MSLTDLIEHWLKSHDTKRWKIDRNTQSIAKGNYIVCSDHTYPMMMSHDYIIVIFDTYIVPLTMTGNIVNASDPEFINKLSNILESHYSHYHDVI